MGRPFSSVYFSPDRGAADTLIGFIDRATATLDCAVYSITHDGIAEALIRAHGRGVKVRVLMDKTQAGGQYADDEKLEAAGIPVLRDRTSGLMHHKFAICDYDVGGQYAVATGSFNWTRSADETNSENFLIIRLKHVVEDYQREFDRLWEIHSPDEP